MTFSVTKAGNGSRNRAQVYSSYYSSEMIQFCINSNINIYIIKCKSSLIFAGKADFQHLDYPK